MKASTNPRHRQIKIIGFCISFVAILCIFIGSLLFLPWELNQRNGIDVHIHRGRTPKQIALLLKESGIIRHKKSFLWAAKILGVSRELQAGKYHFEGSLTHYSVLKTLSKGLVITTWITFPEGLRAKRIADIVENKFGISSTRFMELVTDKAYCRRLGIDAPDLEGYLFPNTYRFHLDPTPEEIIETMVSEFSKAIDDSLKDRAKQLGFTIHQLITLASIVEGEAVLDSERTTIAALYQNRLKRRMRLQADPTIQYIIQDGPRRLLHDDLEIESPYNTYLYAGLPPGPVNNPGIASIRATLYPASVDVLYMVANGDGSHTFSRTISEHNEAKAKFDRVREGIRRGR